MSSAFMSPFRPLCILAMVVSVTVSRIAAAVSRTASMASRRFGTSPAFGPRLRFLATFFVRNTARTRAGF
eukprot:2126067-Lingulodinium_polyedra.AAC.1